ncbi:MAG: YheC/YheD family protein [Cytobacillus gottheilii]|uniref:YheC/YheD family endospore coat-associated protein n=1 Tax=Cytobacillus gottheilii TaxID=859144 RepID=UPI003463970C
MNVFYCPSDKSWYSDEVLTFGSSGKPVQRRETGNHEMIPFSLSLKGNNAGPLVGILTGEDNHGNLAGNGPLFMRLQKELLHQGGVSVVFTAKHWHKSGVNGFLYSPAEDKWIPVSCPFPHLIYNRAPFRKHENTQSFHNAITNIRKMNIPFFNPGFIEKKELYELISSSEDLAPYLPATLTNPTASKLKSLLQQYKRIYLKPSRGAKGKGIYVAEWREDHAIALTSHTAQSLYPSFQLFWKDTESQFKHKDYIAQEAISPALIHGSRYDFRILVHYADHSYNVTGIGLRVSNSQQITTHIPNGGKILPYTLIQTKQHDQFIEYIAAKLGHSLSEAFGFFGEFSIDAGISDTGDYYIYEVNSKPMSFDEEEIESKRIQQLCTLFFKETGFKPFQNGMK